MKMNSLDVNCLTLKKDYDDCFNTWFSEQFLKGDSRDTCAPLFQVYQKCVKVILQILQNVGRINKNRLLIQYSAGPF